MKKVQMSVVVDAEDWMKLKNIAEQTDMSLARLLRVAIRRILVDNPADDRKVPHEKR